jgi:hypothetical protein
MQMDVVFVRGKDSRDFIDKSGQSLFCLCSAVVVLESNLNKNLSLAEKKPGLSGLKNCTLQVQKKKKNCTLLAK